EAPRRLAVRSGARAAAVCAYLHAGPRGLACAVAAQSGVLRRALRPDCGLCWNHGCTIVQCSGLAWWLVPRGAFSSPNCTDARDIGVLCRRSPSGLARVPHWSHRLANLPRRNSLATPKAFVERWDWSEQLASLPGRRIGVAALARAFAFLAG